MFLEKSKKNNMKNLEYLNKRKAALSWWDKLYEFEKFNFSQTYYPERNQMTLTGREIQAIFENQNEKGKEI